MKTRMYLAVVTVLALGCPLVAQENPDLWVYEGFNYTPASATADPGSAQGTGSEIILTDKGGTTEKGLSGTWANANNDAHNMYLVEGSLSFGDLPTTGNHIRYRDNSNSDRYNRQLTTAASDSINSASEVWFSFLANRLQNNFSAGREGIAIANGTVSSAQFDGISPTGRHGFGAATTDGGSGWQAWGWDGTAGVVGTESFTVPVDGSQVNLLIGRVSFDSGLEGKDVFTLYHYVLNEGSMDGGQLSQIDSIEVNVDQALLDTLNVTRQVNTAYDEIRIGRTLTAVTGGPPPPPAGTVIVIK